MKKIKDFSKALIRLYVGQYSMQSAGVDAPAMDADHQSGSVWGGKTLAGALIIAVLSAVSPLSHAITLTETFEDETNGSTTFSEPGGPGFTTNTDLLVEEFNGLGSGNSDFWLGTGFAGAGNGSSGSSGNIGSITVASGWSFIINSFDAWSGRDNGQFFFPGDVRFIGTKIDSSLVQADITINTLNDFDFVTGLNFGGTPLAGVALTSLSIELLTGAPLDYLALDNINYDASQITSPPPAAPEPSIVALLCLCTLGLIGYRRHLNKLAA